MSILTCCCTGNSAIYPAASSLPPQKPSHLLKQDLIQRGNYALFDGPSGTKQWISIMLPLGLLFYFATLCYCLNAYTEDHTKGPVSKLCAFISPKTFASIHLWALEKLPRKRLLKKNALFSLYLLAIGTGGMVLYTVKHLDADVNLSCFVWNLDATSLAPYQGRDQVSEAFYWLFTFLAVLLNCGFLYQIIQTRDDKHERNQE